MTLGAKATLGFTLIELMIVVAIVGILAAVAYPSYMDSVRKSRRADARSALVQAAQFMEKNYSITNDYSKRTDNSAIALPFTQSPIDSSTKYYNIAIDATTLTATTYALTATPIVGTSQASDVCATLTLTSVGTKTSSSGRSDCW